MIKNLGKRQTPREGDYYNSNGVLVCGKCGKEREWHGYFAPVGMTWAPCVCSCDEKNRIHNEEAKAVADRRKLAAMRRNWAFPEGSDLWKIRFDNDDKRNLEATKAVQHYAKFIPKQVAEGNNLLLFGGVGTGKSFFAAAVLNYAIDAGYRCLFAPFTELVNDYLASFDKRGFINDIKGYDVVVFDDLGVERGSAAANEAVYEIVNSRYLAGKPSIITTNMDRRELNPQDMNRKRVISRILEKATVVPVSGEDRRTEKYRR